MTEPKKAPIETLIGVLKDRLEKRGYNTGEDGRQVVADLIEMTIRSDSTNSIIQRVENAIGTQNGRSGGYFLSNEQNIETANLFSTLLTNARDVFGEEHMTDSAIASICESASYIVYRTVMGPKNGDTQPDPWLSRKRG